MDWQWLCDNITGQHNCILGRNDNDHREGVAIMMSIEVKKSMKERTPKSERRMVARFKFRYTTLSKVVRSNEGREKTMEKMDVVR